MKTLLVGFEAKDRIPRSADTVCHALDIYHRHAIEKIHHVKTICSPHLPEDDWSLIRFKTGPKRMSGELSLDLMQECVEMATKKGAKLEVEFEGRERDRNDLLNKAMGKDARKRSFAATWQTSVPGVEPITLKSYPGCFCHRRPDDGGLALAEVVSRDLAAMKTFKSAVKFLDMGCGSGMVGLLAAKSFGPGLGLVMVDSHSRAVEAAKENAASLGIAAEVILADDGTPARMDGTFDVFAGNPPYYSEYRIAEVFLETANRALKPGGAAYLVCKNAAGLEPVQRKCFDDVEIVKRRGYSVLKSVKKGA